jgi:DNA-binding NtrC family response regulator
VRELKNVVERAAILSSDVITVADLPEDPHESPFDDDEAAEHDASAHPTPTPAARKPTGERLTLREYREAAERAYIVETLQSLDWNISKTAATLGVERTNLHKKIRSYGIKRGEG